MTSDKRATGDSRLAAALAAAVATKRMGRGDAQAVWNERVRPKPLRTAPEALKRLEFAHFSVDEAVEWMEISAGVPRPLEFGSHMGAWISDADISRAFAKTTRHHPPHTANRVWLERSKEWGVKHPDKHLPFPSAGTTPRLFQPGDEAIHLASLVAMGDMTITAAYQRWANNMTSAVYPDLPSENAGSVVEAWLRLGGVAQGYRNILVGVLNRCDPKDVREAMERIHSSRETWTAEETRRHVIGAGLLTRGRPLTEVEDGWKQLNQDDTWNRQGDADYANAWCRLALARQQPLHLRTLYGLVGEEALHRGLTRFLKESWPSDILKLWLDNLNPDPVTVAKYLATRAAPLHPETLANPEPMKRDDQKDSLDAKRSMEASTAYLVHLAHNGVMNLENAAKEWIRLWDERKVHPTPGWEPWADAGYVVFWYNFGVEVQHQLHLMGRPHEDITEFYEPMPKFVKPDVIAAGLSEWMQSSYKTKEASTEENQKVLDAVKTAYQQGVKSWTSPPKATDLSVRNFIAVVHAVAKGQWSVTEAVGRWEEEDMEMPPMPTAHDYTTEFVARWCELTRAQKRIKFADMAGDLQGLVPDETIEKGQNYYRVKYMPLSTMDDIYTLAWLVDHVSEGRITLSRALSTWKDGKALKPTAETVKAIRITARFVEIWCRLAWAQNVKRFAWYATDVEVHIPCSHSTIIQGVATYRSRLARGEYGAIPAADPAYMDFFTVEEMAAHHRAKVQATSPVEYPSPVVKVEAPRHPGKIASEHRFRVDTRVIRDYQQRAWMLTEKVRTGTITAEFAAQDWVYEVKVPDGPSQLPERLAESYVDAGESIIRALKESDRPEAALTFDLALTNVFHSMISPGGPTVAEWRDWFHSDRVPAPEEVEPSSRTAVAISTLRDDAKEIALRTGVRRIRALAQARMSLWWAKTQPPREGESREAWEARVQAFLGTEQGEAVVSLVLGCAWEALGPSVPQEQVRAFGDSIARELRLSAGADLLDGAIDGIVTPMVAAFTEAAPMTLGGSGIRVLPEESQGVPSRETGEKEDAPVGEVARRG